MTSDSSEAYVHPACEDFNRFAENLSLKIVQVHCPQAVELPPPAIQLSNVRAKASARTGHLTTVCIYWHVNLQHWRFRLKNSLIAFPISGPVSSPLSISLPEGASFSLEGNQNRVAELDSVIRFNAREPV
jgi:hypothetical protein